MELKSYFTDKNNPQHQQTAARREAVAPIQGTGRAFRRERHDLPGRTLPAQHGQGPARALF